MGEKQARAKSPAASQRATGGRGNPLGKKEGMGKGRGVIRLHPEDLTTHPMAGRVPKISDMRA